MPILSGDVTDTLVTALADTVQLEPTDPVAALSNRLFQISLERAIGSKRETLMPMRPPAPITTTTPAPAPVEENPEDFCNPNAEEKVLLKKVFAKKFSMRKASDLKK